ncbi:hypothetical protein KJS94_16420 [Flavihumibacter rivuli]|uniref:DUF6010 family protein n=1 Tax=Flavihumibacter rivuli TaxID=2838156 RepID=UPI001BDE6EFB|nr:DUF6010 family protein [Flavihumibacter rivuli]ULQ56236.1 hypothetical protein KJS94_16420 [Flavihumibacter rivuli]
MIGFLIGFATAATIIAIAEMFKKLDLKFYASLNLAVIPFIYIGFSIQPGALLLTVPAAILFLLFAYAGYKKSYLFTVIGLALHGLWDIFFPHVSPISPSGYDIFCITIDIMLALYFYYKLPPPKNTIRNP